MTVGGAVGVDMKRVKARKDAVSGNSRTGLETWLKGMANCTIYKGHARFETRHDVRVGEELLSADRIFLNVGGRALVPDMAGLDQVNFLTNTSMLDLDVLPRHLVIVGGGYVALEFAQMYRRFGSEVTVVEKGPRLIQREDEEVSAAVQDILEAEGIRIRLRAECISFAQLGADIAVGVDCESGDREVVGSHVLLAVGRRPNTDDLGLDRAGIETDKLGYIMVDDQLRTNMPGVWALGDCNGKGAFTHTSYNDFEIIAANLLDGDRRRVSDRLPCPPLMASVVLIRMTASPILTLNSNPSSVHRQLLHDRIRRGGRSKKREYGGERAGKRRSCKLRCVDHAKVPSSAM